MNTQKDEERENKNCWRFKSVKRWVDKAKDFLERFEKNVEWRVKNFYRRKTEIRWRINA